MPGALGPWGWSCHLLCRRHQLLSGHHQSNIHHSQQNIFVTEKPHFHSVGQQNDENDQLLPVSFPHVCAENWGVFSGLLIAGLQITQLVYRQFGILVLYSAFRMFQIISLMFEPKVLVFVLWFLVRHWCSALQITKLCDHPLAAESTAVKAVFSVSHFQSIPLKEKHPSHNCMSKY